MKLKYYQQGGTFVPPFAVYQGTIDFATNTRDNNSKNNSDKINGITKELLSKMDSVLNSLPVDAAYVKEHLTTLFQNIEYKLRNSDNILGESDSIVRDYMQVNSIIGKLKLQEEAYKKALESAIAKDNLNEVAIDSMGRIMTYSETDGYNWISVNLYNEDFHVPITNALLLDLRANREMGLAFDTASLTTVADGVSMGSIAKNINDQLKELGSREITSQGYTNQEAKDILQGIKLFRDLKTSESISSLLKQTIISKDLAEQITSAFNYIFNNLSTKEKALLLFKSKTIEGLEGVLANLINQKQSIKYTIEPVDDSSTSSAGKDDFLLKLMTARGGVQEILNIDPGSGIEIEVEGRRLSAIENLNGEVIVDKTIQDVLVESGIYKEISNVRNISFGDQLVTQDLLKNIIYENTGIFRVNLPINPDGTVRFSILKDWEEANRLIKEENYSIKDAYKKMKLDDLIKPDGNLNETKFGPFLLIEGMTSSSNGIEDSDFLVNKGDLDDVSATKLETMTSLDIDEGHSLNLLDHMFGWDKLYKGLIFIPIHNNKASLVNGNLAISEDQKYMDFEKKKGKTQGLNKESTLWKK